MYKQNKIIWYLVAAGMHITELSESRQICQTVSTPFKWWSHYANMDIQYITNDGLGRLFDVKSP